MLVRTSTTGPSPLGSPARMVSCSMTYHPSYLLRQYNQEAKREAWEDLKKVLHFVYD